MTDSAPKLLTFTAKSAADLIHENIFGPNESPLLKYPFSIAVSRIKTNFDLFNYKLESEYIPDLVKSKKQSFSWEECCQQRAAQLMKLNKDKYYISYSGGIDSTTALASLLKFWPKDFLERLVIYMNSESIKENPSFFLDHIMNKFPIFSSFSEISSKLVSEDALLITGELGDQLFGSDMLGPGSTAFGDETLHQSYEKYTPLYINAYLENDTEGTGERIFSVIKDIVTESPIPIKTTFDFFWWLNFSQKWQNVKFRYLERNIWSLKATYGNHILHFFDTPEFQHWSLDNHDLKIGKGWADYKIAAKNFLYNFTKNSEMKDLRKVLSLDKIYIIPFKRVAINSHLEEVGYSDLGKYKKNKSNILT